MQRGEVNKSRVVCEVYLFRVCLKRRKLTKATASARADRTGTPTPLRKGSQWLQWYQ